MQYIKYLCFYFRDRNAGHGGLCRGGIRSHLPRNDQLRVLHWRRVRGLNTLRWCHNESDSVSHHRRLDCLLNRLFRRRSRRASKLRVTGLCEGNSPETGEVPAQRASDAEKVSIWWRHHGSGCWFVNKLAKQFILMGLLLIPFACRHIWKNRTE